MVLDLEIEKVIWRGRGIARLDSGKVVMVIGGVFPKEKVRVNVLREKRDYVEAILQEVLVKHPARRKHPCVLSDQCGGCRWGSVWEWFQISLKKNLLIDELKRRIKGFDFPLHRIALFLSPDPWRYRFRAQIHVLNHEPCFKEINSNRLIKLKDCLLLNRSLSESLCLLSSRLPDGRFTVAGSPLTGEVLTEQDSGFIKLPLEDFGIYLLIRPRSFFQANWKLNQSMVKFVVSKVNDSEKVADLYAGAGNFSIPLAIQNKKVIALERDPFCVKSMVECCGEFGIKTFEAVECDISRTDHMMAILKPFCPEVIIIDPPRAGCGKRMIELNRIQSLKKMVWVSCDVVNTLRDLGPFLKTGWEIKEIALFDMFPQTWHMEVVFVLVRERKVA